MVEIVVVEGAGIFGSGLEAITSVDDEAKSCLPELQAHAESSPECGRETALKARLTGCWALARDAPPF